MTKLRSLAAHFFVLVTSSLLCVEAYAAPTTYTATPVFPINQPPLTANLTTSYEITKSVKQKDKTSDYCVTVQIENRGPDDVNDWRLSFDLGFDTLTSLQHGTTDNSVGRVVFTPGKEHTKIKQGQKRKVGFCAHENACVIVPPSSVDPQITIVAPSASLSLAGDTVFVQGTYSGPSNTGVTVNGKAAHTDGLNFYANDIPLTDGSNVIEATVSTLAGKQTTTQITVEKTGPSFFDFRALSETGTAPLEVEFKIAYAGDPSLQSTAIDFDGDGVTDLTAAGQNTILRHTYATPGIYLATATARDANGVNQTQTIAIAASHTAAIDTKVNEVFLGLKNALTCGDVETALLYVSPLGRDRYQPIFEALRPNLSTIVGDWSPLQQSLVSAKYAEYAINRIIDGINRVFFVYFIEDDDGVWRIDSL